MILRYRYVIGALHANSARGAPHICRLFAESFGRARARLLGRSFMGTELIALKDEQIFTGVRVCFFPSKDFQP